MENNEEFIRRLYKLKPLEWIHQHDESYWLRVPGGWIYSDEKGSVFVPFNNEFMPK